jgi:hypothetical protein
MAWVESKSVGFFLPALTDEFVNGRTAGGLESLGEVIGGVDSRMAASNS